jgi:hypothetical protein
MSRAVRNTRTSVGPVTGYWDRSQWPLQSLYFLLPVLLLYHIGTLFYAPAGRLRLPSIVAERLLGYFFQLFGVTGYYLPGALVVVVLLCWHLARRDPWRPEIKLYPMMWAETLLLALPLFVFMWVLFRGSTVQWSVEPAMPLANAADETAIPTWQIGVIFSIGAGIYEELLFRLVGIALIHLVLVDVLALPEKYGATAAIALSALAFAGYHFLGQTPFDLSRFAFYAIAGIYFAAVYLLRGFGIAAGSHAMYDVLVVTTRFLQG